MTKREKSVLIVDDQPAMCASLKDRFIDCNRMLECPYQFRVDTAQSTQECIEKLRSAFYDVIVMDVRLQTETDGLEATVSMGLHQQFGAATPVRIIFTGYPSYRDCVRAMRSGAWDYLVKEDIDGTSIFKLVASSAVERLQRLDLRLEQEKS